MKLFLLLFALSGCMLPQRAYISINQPAPFYDHAAAARQQEFNDMVQADQLQRMENQLFRANQARRFPGPKPIW